MKCNFCNKRLYHPKMVHTQTGVFHGACLDKLHAATEGVGQLLGAFFQWQRKGSPGNMDGITTAIQGAAKPLGEYLKQLAENVRNKERKEGPKKRL